MFDCACSMVGGTPATGTILIAPAELLAPVPCMSASLTLQHVTRIAPVFKPLLAFAPRYRAHRGGNATARAQLPVRAWDGPLPAARRHQVAGEIACLQFAMRRLP